MANDNLARLALKLVSTSIAEDGSVYLASDDHGEATAKLEGKLRSEVNELLGEIREAIPNDFTFSCLFASGRLRLAIEFVDGNTVAGAGGGFFTSRKSLLGKIRSIDWDSKRSELIEKGSIFEDMVRAAADRPVKIPSSRDAANRYATELGPVLEELKGGGDLGPFQLVTGKDNEGVTFHEEKTRKGIIRGIGDAMATNYDILGVVEDGVEWSFDAIESAKLEAIECLGPISRAKAEKRFFA